MTHIIHELQKSKWPSVPVPQAGPAVQEEMEEVAEVPPCIPLRQTSVVKFPSRRLWKDREQVRLLNREIHDVVRKCSCCTTVAYLKR